MKGVVLAGGRGTRLRPMTYVTNKHVLPIYDEPLIYYPVKTLVNAGIDEIMVISSPEHIGRFIRLLEEDFEEPDFTYRVQQSPDGIADAVSLAENFVDDEFAVILGDNIILEDMRDKVQDFTESDAGCRLFLKEVDEPAAYGIAEVEDGRITSIKEKPDDPSSKTAVTGFYLYESDVFEKIANISPSDRGEMEITDVNKKYMSEGNLEHDIVEGEWFDAGTPEGLFNASKHARAYKQED